MAALVSAAAPSWLHELFPGRPIRAGGREVRVGRRGSLAINPRAGIWYDHEAGCGGGLVDLVMHARGGSPAEAREWLRARRIEIPSEGLTGTTGRHADSERDAARAAEAAATWAACRPAAGSPVEAYLRRRGIVPPPGLRAGYLPHLAAVGGPAMIVAATRGGRVRAVQATAITEDGQRRLRGGRTWRHTIGPAAGAVVWLVPGAAPAVAEGAETALAALQLLGGGPAGPDGAAATLGAAGMARLAPALLSQDGRPPERVHVCADADPAGLAAAEALAARLAEAGIPAALHRPARGDFADAAQARAARRREAP